MEGDPGGKRTETVSWTRQKIFDTLAKNKKLNTDLDGQINILMSNLLKRKAGSIEIPQVSRNKLKKILCTLKSKWKAANYMAERFLAKNESWLNESTKITISLIKKQAHPEKDVQHPRSSGGRPTNPFSESCDRTKRRKTAGLREEYTHEELAFATKVSLRSAGAVSASKVNEDVTMKSPTRADKYRAALKKSCQPASAEEISSDIALCLVLNSKLTKAQYQNIRNTVKSQSKRILPPYQSVFEAKKRCYPTNITVSETCAEVKLQPLLNKTCDRILQMQSEVLDHVDNAICESLSLIVKWGFDGSSGQKEYKQKFEDENSTDSSVLLTSIVPLQLYGFDKISGLDVIVWKNPRPSPRFCRPIRLQFLREDKESTLNEKNHIDEQIASLVNYKTVIDGKEIQVSFELTFTMIDGKVSNVVTGTTSSMRCLICSATAKDLNNIEKMQKQVVNMSNMQYGLSTLHCWIRFFECLLHVGYKKDSEKWQSRGEDIKKSIEKRKKVIQARFKNEPHLLIDRPKQGMGNSNDGNTARWFFENTTVSARILGVNEELMKRFHVILQVLASGFNANIKSFEKYCLDTAQLFVALYPWYKMPTTVHKVLIHGPKIIEMAILPIGQLSEEAQEARNKDVRNYRENFSRKCSREKTLEDIFLRLLATSDPLISSLQKAKPQKSKKLFPEAIALLAFERFDDDDDDNNEGDGDDDV